MTTPPSAEADADVLPESPAPTARALRHPAAVALGILLVYAALVFLNSPDGYLGTDTGGKVLTLDRIEERGSLGGLDVGYWAEEADPDGALHGYFGTTRFGDEWVQVTTVPMIVAARPLYETGGYRLALLVPMLGGLATAFAARALVRRLGGTTLRATQATWVVGLVGPVLLYAVDLWEHTIGLAAMGWAVVAALDAARRWPDRIVGAVACAVGSGFLWGFAYSMRTEALAYGAVVTAVIVLDRFLVRRVVDGLGIGFGTSVGLALAVAANTLAEKAVLGDGLRGGRAGGTASRFGSELERRFDEGLITTFGFGGADRDVMLGLVAVVAVIVLIRRSLVTDRRPERADLVLIGIAIAAASIALSDGLGFVPGLLTASPIAIIGLASHLLVGRGGSMATDLEDPDGSQRRRTVLLVAAVAALPVVWMFQYLGGAGPQWGGRYVLLTSFLLTVLGVVGFDRVGRTALHFVVGASLVMTVFGAAWMVQRTHAFASAGRDLAAIDQPVLIAKDGAGFLPREFVAENGERRWLATLGSEELDEAAEIVADAGHRSFGLLVIGGADAPEEVGAFERGDTTIVDLLPGAHLEVIDYSLDDAP